MFTYPAESTLPKKTSSTSSGLTSGTRSTAAIQSVCQSIHPSKQLIWEELEVAQNSPLMAWAPNCTAVRLERELWTRKKSRVSGEWTAIETLNRQNSPQEGANRGSRHGGNVDGGEGRHGGDCGWVNGWVRAAAKRIGLDVGRSCKRTFGPLRYYREDFAVGF